MRRPGSWTAALAVACSAVAIGGSTAGGQAPPSPIDSAWLSDSLAREGKPAAVRNNLVRGALARRTRATRRWRAADTRHDRALAQARRARGKRRARLLRAARAAAPSPLSKPEYVVVWAGNQNAGDLSGRTTQEELGRLIAKPDDALRAREKFAPGTDAFVVLDGRRENVDGSRNPTYGKVVNFVQMPLPWGVEAEPHHMQYQWEPGQPLLAGGLFNDTTFVLGVDKIPQLELKNTITPAETPGGSVPDAYDYAGEGRFVGTYMGGPQANYGGSPGEVVVFKPDPVKGMVVESEVAGGKPGARQSGNPGGIPEPCNEDEAFPLDTCSNPHGVQVRPDLDTMVTSDYAEPKLVVMDPAKPDGGKGFRPTVRVWDTSDVDRPKLKSVAHMPPGWRGFRKNTMGANRGVMENAKTWPASSRYPNVLPSRAIFAGAMCGGGIFVAPDMTALEGDSSRRFKQVWDDGISMLDAREGNVDDFVRDQGGCEGGAWMQVSRDNRKLFRIVGGNAPNQDNTTSAGHATKIVYDLDVTPLLQSAADGAIACDLTRGIDTDGDRKVDVSAVDAVKRLARGEALADCPRLIDTLKVDDKTTGGPHWAAIDNHSLRPDGSPSRLVFSDYFVARSGVDGDHKVHMVDVGPNGSLDYERRWRDEQTGELGVNFNRDDWPGNPDAGFYKPHSMVWVCPPATCEGDTPASSTPAVEASDREQSVRFDGSCSFEGRFYGEQPYHLLPERNGGITRAGGTCTGTLDGRRYDGPAQLYLDGRMDAFMTCEATQPNQIGQITFGSSHDDLDAPQLRIALRGAHGGTDMAVEVTGAYNGRGAGLQRFQADLPNDAQRCAGEGLLELPMTLDFTTLTQLYG